MAPVPPQASFRNVTATVWLPVPKVPFSRKLWVCPALSDATAINVPPICLPSMETVKLGSPAASDVPSLLA